MSLKRLAIHHFRNISEAGIELSPGVNLFHGDNGSGKTSLLRVLAGFDEADGYIRCGSSVWLDSAASINVPTNQRGLGFMFQDARLFAHLNVAENLQYAWRRSRDVPQVRV